MQHELTHRMFETIRGMKIEVKIKAPVGADVGPLIEKMAKIIAWARKDPDQFNLLLEKEDEE